MFVFASEYDVSVCVEGAHYKYFCLKKCMQVLCICSHNAMLNDQKINKNPPFGSTQVFFREIEADILSLCSEYVTGEAGEQQTALREM